MDAEGSPYSRPVSALPFSSLRRRGARRRVIYRTAQALLRKLAGVAHSCRLTGCAAGAAAGGAHLAAVRGTSLRTGGAGMGYKKSTRVRTAFIAGLLAGNALASAAPAAAVNAPAHGAYHVARLAPP